MSAHDLMQSREKGLMKDMEHEWTAKQKEEEAMEERVQKQMAEKVKLEISKKALLKKDDKRKRKESVDDRGRAVSSARIFAECTISPVSVGRSVQDHSFSYSLLAWNTDDPSQTYLVSQFQFQIGNEEEIESQMAFSKNFRHINIPVVYDWDIVVTGNDAVLRVLTNDFKHIAAKDILRLGETVSVANATAVLSTFLSVAEEMQNEFLCKSFLPILSAHFNDYVVVELEDIWFDADGNPVFSSVVLPSSLKSKTGFTAQEKYPNWSQLPQTPACQIGILLLEMIAGDLSSFSSPLDCASKMYKLNRDL